MGFESIVRSPTVLLKLSHEITSQQGQGQIRTDLNIFLTKNLFGKFQKSLDKDEVNISFYTETRVIVGY